MTFHAFAFGGKHMLYAAPQRTAVMTNAVNYYICRANGVPLCQQCRRNLKDGYEMTRCVLSIEPLGLDHNDWSGRNCTSSITCYIKSSDFEVASRFLMTWQTLKRYWDDACSTAAMTNDTNRRRRADG